MLSEGLWRRAYAASAYTPLEKQAFGIADDIYEAGLLFAYLAFVPFCETGGMDSLSLRRLLENTFQLDLEAMRELCLWLMVGNIFMHEHEQDYNEVLKHTNVGGNDGTMELLYPVILLSYFYARAMDDLEHQMCFTHLFLFTKLNKVVSGPRNPGVIGDRGSRSGSFSRECQPGNAIEPGNEEGYIVGMSTCYPSPGSVKIYAGETLTLVSNYSCSQRHTGFWCLFSGVFC